MKFTVSTFLTALLGFAGGLFFPWWIIAVTSFIVAVFIHQRPLPAYAAGFIGLYLLWGIHAFIIDLRNHSLLSGKVAQILPVGSSINLILITATIGGIVSGFAALTGSYTRKSVSRKRKKIETNHI
jgi:FtsH-binding integral membrane protein